MTSFSDDFNRANSTDLGANWVEVSGDWSIVSNQLSPGAAGGTIILRAAGAMASNDNYAQVTIAATTAASQGVWCRGNSNITSGYLWRNDGTSWNLFSVVGGSFTSIGSFAAAAAPGDVAKVQAAGSTIKGYVNGVEKVSVTDTGVATGTSVGIRSESSASIAYDSFSAADVAATVTGTATAAFGALTATANGVPTVLGTASGTFGALTAAATGLPTVLGTAAGSFGALTGTANGTPKVIGSATLNGGALTGSSTGLRTVVSSASGAFGALTATALVASHITGTGAGDLGPLSATAEGGVPVVTTQTSGSWYQLLSFKAEAIAWKTWERTSPPLACPFDGEPLRDTPRSQPGGKYCPLGDYRWPQQPRII